VRGFSADSSFAAPSTRTVGAALSFWFMGLSAVIEGESGDELERVDDVTNILHRLLPSKEGVDYRSIWAIDCYGDTVFNYLQIPRFLVEWRQMAACASRPTEVALVQTIERMAERVGSDRHIYLKFYGD